MNISQKIVLGFGLAFALQPVIWSMEVVDETKVDNNPDKTLAFETAERGRITSIESGYQTSKRLSDGRFTARVLGNEIKKTPPRLEKIDVASQISIAAIGTAELQIQIAYQEAERRIKEIEKEQQNLKDLQDKREELLEKATRFEIELPKIQERCMNLAKRGTRPPVLFDKPFVIHQTTKDGEGKTKQTWPLCNHPVSDLLPLLDERLKEQLELIKASPTLIAGEYEQNEERLQTQAKSLVAKYKVLQSPVLQVIEPQAIEQAPIEIDQKDVPSSPKNDTPSPSRSWNIWPIRKS